MTLSKRRNVVAFKVFKKFKAFFEFFRVFNRDGFNFCPIAMFYREIIIIVIIIIIIIIFYFYFYNQ